MDLKRFGNLVTELRKEKGISQEQLAEQMYLNRQTISRWERGLGFPEYESLFLLSNILDISVEELFNGKRKKNIVNYNFVFLIIIFVILIFLFIFISYFCTNYKKNVVYTFSAQSNNVTIKNGFLSFFSDKFYFNLGDVDFENNVIVNKENIRYTLFYNDEGEKKFIYSSTIEDDTVYLDSRFFSEKKNIFFGNIYLQIDYMQNEILSKELLILNLQKQYVNDDFFEEDVDKFDNDFFAIDYLLKNDFKLCEKCENKGVYLKKLDNFEIYIDLKNKKIVTYYSKQEDIFKLEYEDNNLFLFYDNECLQYNFMTAEWFDKRNNKIKRVDIDKKTFELWMSDFRKIKNVVDI